MGKRDYLVTRNKDVKTKHYCRYGYSDYNNPLKTKKSDSTIIGLNQLSNTTIWWLDICSLLHRYQLHVSALMAIFRLKD